MCAALTVKEEVLWQSSTRNIPNAEPWTQLPPFFTTTVLSKTHKEARDSLIFLGTGPPISPTSGPQIYTTFHCCAKNTGTWASCQFSTQGQRSGSYRGDIWLTIISKGNNGNNRANIGIGSVNQFQCVLLFNSDDLCHPASCGFHRQHLHSHHLAGAAAGLRLSSTLDALQG